MKLVGMISAAVLSLLLGAAVPAYALQEQHEQEAKPAPQEERKAQPEKPQKQEQKAAQKQEKPTQQQKAAKQEKPEPKPEKQAKQEKSAPKPEKQAKQEKPAAQQEKNARQEKTEPQQKNARQEQRNAPQRQQHEQQAQRAGNNGGGRIPEDRYRAHFGQQHTFRVSQADYSRDRRFQYGGYWFGFVDPWPSNWLYTQNVYVIDINGVYYLCNPMYPGVNIALSVTL